MENLRNLLIARVISPIGVCPNPALVKILQIHSYVRLRFFGYSRMATAVAYSCEWLMERRNSGSSNC